VLYNEFSNLDFDVVAFQRTRLESGILCVFLSYIPQLVI